MKTAYLIGEVCAFLIEKDKGPMWLGNLSVKELDIVSERMTVAGILPENLYLSKFPNGSTIEFQHRSYGRRDEYYQDGSFIVIKNCRLTKCWIPDLLSPFPHNGQKSLEILAIIEGDIEVIDENN